MLLSGRPVAETIKIKLKRLNMSLAAQGQKPGLAILIVGEDPASRIYSEMLVKTGAAIGVPVFVETMPAQAALEDIVSKLETYNLDPAVSGILPMMPMPPGIDGDSVAKAIAPRKDVDSIHPFNAGLVALGKSRWAPCTPRAVMAILDYYRLPVAGKHAVIIGRSNVVGKPLAHLLLGRDATVTLCHSRTEDLGNFTRQADILIAAVGRPRFVAADMIKPGAVVIDVGINETTTGVVGDVDFSGVEPVAAAITPVPGGVGTVSTVMVMEAVLRQAGCECACSETM